MRPCNTRGGTEERGGEGGSEAGARRTGDQRGRGPTAVSGEGCPAAALPATPSAGRPLTFRMRRLMMDSAAKTRSPTADSSILLLSGGGGGGGAHSP